MSSPEPTLAELAARLDAVEDRNDLQDAQLAAILGPDEPAPAGLPAPTGFTFTLNPDRSSRCAWVDPAGAQPGDTIEVHEFDTDPLNTLKATVALGVGQRTSSVLQGGRNYTYGARTKRVTGGTTTYSPWTQRITLYVPAAGETTAPTTPGTSTPPPAGANPSDVLDLRFWTIMSDTGSQGDPDNEYRIGQSVDGRFFVRPDGGVVFRARAGGVHSPGSKYCRWEARQMADSAWTKAAWSSSGSHSLECVLAIDARGLTARRRINGMQIHDGGDDVCQIMRHESLGLGFMHNDGKSWVSIDPGYVDGTKFRCKITAAAGRIVVHYNGVKKVDVAKTGTGWYWKMGCYLQTDVPNWGEDPDATGEVVIWSYTMTGGAT